MTVAELTDILLDCPPDAQVGTSFSMNTGWIAKARAVKKSQTDCGLVICIDAEDENFQNPEPRRADEETTIEDL
jgi:hypothetical protein